MESGAESRDRVPISSSHDGVNRNVGSTDSTASPGGRTKPSEKKKEHQPPRSSIAPTSHHRSSHTSSSGALDLQAVVGRSSSSISGVTVPIRLDALSYLLNNAVMGNNRMPCQMPYYPPSYPMCFYPQMGCSPYGLCMGSQYCSSAFPNQNPSNPTGFMPCGSQPSMQPFQHQALNINQYLSDTSQIQNKDPFPNFNPQSGMAFRPTELAPNSTGMTMNSAGTSSRQHNNATTPSNSDSWAKKPFEKAENSERLGSSGRFGRNERFGSSERSVSNWNNSSNNEKQSSPQRVFGKFGDRKNEDNWSTRQQSGSFGRGFGGGRFGGPSWRDNSKGQDKEWTFGDRSREVDFGSKRRSGERTERFQDRGGFSKRGRWQGRRDGDSLDPWQQENKEKDSPVWTTTVDTPSSFSLETKPLEKSNGGDEDWETDYPGETTASKMDDTSRKLDVISPMQCSPKTSPSQVLEVAEVFAASPEPPTHSSSGKGTSTTELETEAEDENPTSNLVVPVEDDLQNEEIHTFLVTVDGDDNKGVLVEVNGNDL